MSIQVTDILQVLESFAPKALAEKWDNVGLLVGSPSNIVAKILIGLDPTNTLVDEAIKIGADTVITHHPVIFKPLSVIHTDDPAGRLLQKALSANINIIGCHTNLDSAVDGVNDVLASALGLTDLEPLIPAATTEYSNSGLGRIGIYRQPLDREKFVRQLFDVLQLTCFNIAGLLPDTISKVAMCGGSGSDFTAAAYNSGADVYLSAEIKHATAVWANEVGFAVIDGGHYATEKPVTRYLEQKLTEVVDEKQWQVKVYLTETEKPPFVTVYKI